MVKSQRYPPGTKKNYNSFFIKKSYVKINKRNKRKTTKRNNKWKISKKILGGIQSVQQGRYGTCYSESMTRMILKILKRPDIKLLRDINDLAPDILNTLNEFETQYINNKKEFMETQKGLLLAEIQTALINLESNKKLLRRRNKFVNSNPELKSILDEQNKYYNLFNNFFILNCGIDTGSVFSLMVWFVNYLDTLWHKVKSGDQNDTILKETIKYLENPDDVNLCRRLTFRSECKLQKFDDERRSSRITCDIDYEFLANTLIELERRLRVASKELLYTSYNNYIQLNSEGMTMIDWIKSKIDEKLYLCLVVEYSERSLFKGDLYRGQSDELNYDWSKYPEYCKKPDKKILAHAVNIIGYDDVNKKIIVKNSWGLEWGDFGKIFLDYERFKDKCIANILCIDIIG